MTVPLHWIDLSRQLALLEKQHQSRWFVGMRATVPLLEGLSLSLALPPDGELVYYRRCGGDAAGQGQIGIEFLDERIEADPELVGDVGFRFGILG